MNIKNVLIVGAGTIGRGLAELLLLNRYCVALFAPRYDAAHAAGDKVRANVQRQGVSVGSRFYVKSELIDPGFKHFDVVIEAVPESYPTKLKVWHEIALAASPRQLLASTTSSLSITRLARAVRSPERFVGLHFFNPPRKMRLVEVIRGPATSSAAVDDALTFVESLARTAIVLRDSPGFVVNRVLMISINEAVRLVEEHVASAEEVDTCLELGCNHPMGPLKLADFIGLDVIVSILDAITAETGNQQFAPRPLLRRMVARGLLGKKSGVGFLRYDQQQPAGSWTYNNQLFCNHD